MRGLALLGVVLFHLFGQGRVSGGIDIFLTISGFLFISMLLREVTENDGAISFPRYFGRLFRRIFVPAFIVIVVTVGAGLIIYPAPQHAGLWSNAFASLLYFENIEIIQSHLSYEAAGQEISPFQHFWSLAVQGQFYLVMPFVLLVTYWIARRLKVSATTITGWLLAVVLIASLAYAIYVGSYAQDEAYLMTRTRTWQFAFGGLLALVIDRIRLSGRVRFILGYFGLALIIGVGFVLDGGQLFPGVWALWPLFGLAAILLAAPHDQDLPPTVGSVPKLLSSRFFSWVGDHSYGLYLWHWPLLIFYLTIRDREAVGIRGAAVIFILAVCLSMLMYRFVEQPLDRLGKQRRGPRLDWTSLGAGVVTMTVAASMIYPQIINTGDQSISSLDFDLTSYPGALSVSDEYYADDTDPIPELVGLEQHRHPYHLRECYQVSGEKPGTDEIAVCDDPEAPSNPTAKVVIAAGSHAAHWEKAVRSIGAEYGWEVLLVTKGACVFQDDEKSDRTMCQSWNEKFIDWASDNDVDMVITAGSRIQGEESQESVWEGAENRWHQLHDLGIDLLLVRGTPRPGDNGGACLQAGNSPEECGVVAGDVASAGVMDEMELPEGTETIDMNPYVCPGLEDGPEGWCEPIVGNIIVWYDGQHLTPEFAESAAPAFEREMYKTFPSYFE